MSLNGIQAIEARISQIESRINSQPQINAPSQIASTPLNFQDIIKEKIGNPENINPSQISPLQNKSAATANLKPLAQNNNISCGQTSVAMCINSLTGKSLIDADINNKYGFGLLDALNAESKDVGVNWKDGGTINSNCWRLLEQKVNNEGLPAIVALNGPEFSPSGRGHIVTITKIEGNTVHYADPANGTIKTTTKEAMNNAPSHPDGNFIFYANRQQNDVPPMMMANNFNPYMMLGKNGM